LLCPQQYWLFAELFLSLLTGYSSAEHFTYTQVSARNITDQHRKRRSETNPAWTIEDHIVAIKARIHPLKTIGSELLDAGVSAFRALWPLADAPNTTPELAAKLREAEQRLREWRSSSARAGADAALKFIMTWCEKLDLEKMDTLRRNSPWSTDPILIQRREKMASFFAGYANTKNLSEGDTYSDAEDDEPEEDEYETESDVEAEQGDDGDTREAETEASPQAGAEVTADVASTSQATSAAADVIPDAST
jgi:hypothetical protein